MAVLIFYPKGLQSKLKGGKCYSHATKLLYIKKVIAHMTTNAKNVTADKGLNIIIMKVPIKEVSIDHST